MSQIIQHGNEMIRISPQSNDIATQLDYSRDKGRTWQVRQKLPVAGYGKFTDLTDSGKEIIAMNDKGQTWASTSNGSSWMRRS
jgi:photosystem II stability/assembly factor-like uncharacterized protein